MLTGGCHFINHDLDYDFHLSFCFQNHTTPLTVFGPLLLLKMRRAAC